MRCKMQPTKQENCLLFLCHMCSFKFGNSRQPLKDSCFVCGAYAFESFKKYAYTCQFKHAMTFNIPSPKCFNCKFPINKNLSPPPVKGLLCMICSDFFCCMLDI